MAIKKTKKVIKKESSELKAEIKKVVKIVKQLDKEAHVVTTARCPRCGEFKHEPNGGCDAGI